MSRRDRPLDDIEHEIARTRAELTTTVDTLAAGLAPPRLAEKGVNMISGLFGRSQEIGFGNVRADPVALALIGLGVGWLVAENTGLLDRLAAQLDNKARPAAEPAVSRSDEIPSEARLAGEGDGRLDQAASATQGAPHSIQYRGAAMLERAGKPIAHPVPSGERVRRAGGRLVATIDSHPLLLGLAGLAAGAAAAMLLPTSRRERAIATRARDDLWDKAEALGHRAATSIRKMAAAPPRPPADP